jgi:hypothetical protein
MTMSENLGCIMHSWDGDMGILNGDRVHRTKKRCRSKGKRKVVSVVAEIRIWSCPKDLETVTTLGEINAAAQMRQWLIVEPDVDHRLIMTKTAEIWVIDGVWKGRPACCG